MNNIIKNNESIFDIALKTGSIENVFTIAEQNSISITDDLLPGTQTPIGPPRTRAAHHPTHSEPVSNAPGTDPERDCSRAQQVHQRADRG